MGAELLETPTRWPPTVLAAVVLAATGACAQSPPPAREPAPPAAAEQPARGDAPARSDDGPRLETVATGLEVPWEIAFLPDGRALVTERPGRVRLLSAGGRLERRPVASIDVRAEGEGGLMGLAVDPDFRANRFVYLFRTTGGENVITRHRLDRGRLTDERVILDGIRAAMFHDGGRLRFGPDERLYLATGDALEPSLAQEERSLNGKFLRLGPAQYRGAGGRPEIVSTGHRNPQGFDWRPGDGALFSSEHGPEGDDEVNVVRRGGNYGWPRVQGEEHRSPFAPPVAVYADSLAPSGATFVSEPGSVWTGDFLVGALVGEQIRRLRFRDGRATVDEPLFEGELGRLRTVVEGPDGALYALTNNRDGRGTPRRGDDRVVRIVPPAR
jgi:glucose/arabinose dehydrogenase